MHDPSQPPLVQETILKRRRTLDELAYRRSQTVEKQTKRRRVVRGENVTIKRPEQFVREFRIREGSKNKMNRRKRQVDKRQTIAIPSSEVKKTVGFAVRIHAGRHASPEIKGELRALSLIRKYDGVFINLTKENTARLKALDAYVAYGFVSHQTASDLLHRRAFTEFGGGRRVLSDNTIIEQALGDKNILCLNDLLHEVFTVGPNFTNALSLLCPFRLSSPVGHFEKTILDMHDKVEEKGGFLCGDEMDAFLRKIL